VIALILLSLVECPVRIEIAIDHQGSEFENGFAALYRSSENELAMQNWCP